MPTDANEIKLLRFEMDELKGRGKITLVAMSSIILVLMVAVAYMMIKSWKSSNEAAVLLRLLASGDMSFDKLVVGDRNGPKVAVLSTGIYLFDSGLRPRIIISTIEDKPNITIFDEKSDRLSLGATNLTSKELGGDSVTHEGTMVSFDKTGNVRGRWPD